MRYEGIAAVVQGIPVGGGDFGQRAVEADYRHRRRLTRLPSMALFGPAIHGRSLAAARIADRAISKRGYSPSRNFSASSAAMQPKPAEVIACR